MKHTLLGAAFFAAATALSPLMAQAQEVTLRLHQFLPPPATVPKMILKPWERRWRKPLAGGSRLSISMPCRWAEPRRV